MIRLCGLVLPLMVFKVKVLLFGVSHTLSFVFRGMRFSVVIQVGRVLRFGRAIHILRIISHSSGVFGHRLFRCFKYCLSFFLFFLTSVILSLFMLFGVPFFLGVLKKVNKGSSKALIGSLLQLQKSGGESGFLN